MKIYTKTGDNGNTGLVFGTRVSKADLQIETYGTVDELNAWIGVLSTDAALTAQHALLKEIQDRLFTIGSILATEPQKDSGNKIPEILPSDVTLLENAIDQMNEDLPALKHFVLPGGSRSNADAHVARTVCRRAERLVVALSENVAIEPLVMAYLNRLSDYLFVLSRWALKDGEEIIWKPRR